MAPGKLDANASPQNGNHLCDSRDFGQKSTTYVRKSKPKRLDYMATGPGGQKESMSRAGILQMMLSDCYQVSDWIPNQYQSYFFFLNMGIRGGSADAEERRSLSTARFGRLLTWPDRVVEKTNGFSPTFS